MTRHADSAAEKFVTSFASGNRDIPHLSARDLQNVTGARRPFARDEIWWSKLRR